MNPVPYLVVVWTVGLIALHAFMLYFVYMSLSDDIHLPRVLREPEPTPEAAIAR